MYRLYLYPGMMTDGIEAGMRLVADTIGVQVSELVPFELGPPSVSVSASAIRGVPARTWRVDVPRAWRDVHGSAMNLDEQAELYRSFMTVIRGVGLREPELLNVVMVDAAGKVVVHRGSDHFMPFRACRDGWSFRSYRHTSQQVTCRRCLHTART
jgi:hypothetical protein